MLATNVMGVAFGRRLVNASRFSSGMKASVMSAGFILLMLLSSGVKAADVNIAVLDYGAAMLKSNKAQKMADGIKVGLKKDQEKIMSLEEEITKLTEKAERDGPVMSESEKGALIKQIEDKRLDYGFLVKKFKKRQQEGRDEIVQAIQPQLGEVVQSVVEKGGYDVVLERAAVVYVKDAYDITDDVVKALNKKVD